MSKQEELELKFDKILCDHLIDNHFSVQHLAININSIQKLRALFNQEVTSALEELEKQKVELIEEDPISEVLIYTDYVTLEAIQSIKEKYS